MRSDGLIDMGMIGVEPIDLGLGHELDVEAVRIDGNDGKGVKAIELGILGLDILADDDGVLNADAVRAFGVYARLNGDDHAFAERNFGAEAMGAFVDIEKIAHAVAGAAAVVNAELPYGLTRQNIEILAADTLLELGGGECDNALDHEGEVPTLLIGDLTHGDCAGGIGGSGQVLSAAVVEQEMRMLDLLCGIGLRAVVHHSGIFTHCYYCGEAVALEAGLLCAEGMELFGEGPFGVFVAQLHLLFQPGVELCLGNAVVKIGLVGVFGLNIILAGLEQDDGI